MARILYIDDELDNRMLVKRILLAEGFEFLEANNARDGIDMAIAEQPDLILMDMAMPDMDGLAATSEIRKTPQIASIHIIALTANAMQGDRETYLQAGCDGYISKPIDIDTFINEITPFIEPK
jgi:two-component system, cell cycle response regulator DivK